MLIKEAILKTLSEFDRPLKTTEITEHIIKNQYYQFNAKNPMVSVSSQLVTLIRDRKNPIGRMRLKNNEYYYYLKEKEHLIDFKKYDYDFYC